MMHLKKKLIALVTVCLISVFMVSTVAADISASLEVLCGGSCVSGETVPVETTVQVSGYYEDVSGTCSAAGKMEVYHKVNELDSWSLLITLFDGTVADEETVVKDCKFNTTGYYQFRWIVENNQDYAQLRVATGPVVSEPATVAVLGMALAAIGLVMYTKHPKRQT